MSKVKKAIFFFKTISYDKNIRWNITAKQNLYLQYIKKWDNIFFWKKKSSWNIIAKFCISVNFIWHCQIFRLLIQTCLTFSIKKMSLSVDFPVSDVGNVEFWSCIVSGNPLVSLKLLNVLSHQESPSDFIPNKLEVIKIIWNNNLLFYFIMAKNFWVVKV